MELVNIVIGRFQPFTNGHMACIQYAYQELGIPSIICMIDVPENKVDGKHPFPSKMLLEIYKELFKKNNMIKDIILIKSADIVKIGDELYNMGYQIKSWTCGTDRYAQYERMANKYKEQAHLSDDYRTIEIKRGDEDVSATKVRQALLDDDYKTFASMTPLITLQSRLTGKECYNILRNQILKIKKDS